jgi:hypothetical protein
MMWQAYVVVCVFVVRMPSSVLEYFLKLFVETRAQESQGIATARWRLGSLCCTLACIELRLL